MQYRVIKQTLLALSLALPLVAPNARAAISVTQVSGGGSGAPYDISYMLNTDATSGSVEILNASSTVIRTIPLSGKDLSRGLHYVVWDGKDSGNANAPAGTYTARVTAAADAVPAGGARLWGPNIIATGTNLPMWFPGVSVNRNPGSPYFGRIYVPDYANDRVVAYNPDGSFAMEFNTRNQPVNYFASGTRATAVGADDRLYVFHEANPAPARAVVSMNQDGSDFRHEIDATNVTPRSMFVTGTGDNRRFYFAFGSRGNSGSGGTAAAIYVEKVGETSATLLIDNPSNAATNGGTADGIAVLDSNNDPTGHANSITIFVRTNPNASGAAGAETVTRWDGDNADPTLVSTWTPTWSVAPTNPAVTNAFTGGSVDFAPDGNIWTSLSNASTTVRGFVKLDKNTGAELARITGPSVVTEKPRALAVDAVGNVVGLVLPDSIGDVRARDISMYAPEGPASTDTRTRTFTVSGNAATPLHITAGPNVNSSTTTATITWTTDVNSSSQVFYGMSDTALVNHVTGADGVQVHKVDLSGLTVGSTYFYQVRSAAASNASATSTVMSFVAKNPGPAITDLQATTGLTTAKVTWTTDLATDSTVLYGTSPDALTNSATGTANTTTHSVDIGGLTPGTTYYFAAQSGSALIATTTVFSTFATLAPDGTKVWTLSGAGTLKFGRMDDVLLTAGGITLNKKGAPNGVDDAGVADLPEPRHSMAVVAYGGYLYVLGGRGASVTSTVYYAPIAEDGTVSGWQETTPLADERYYASHAAFGYNGYIYVVGGANLGVGNALTFHGDTLMAKQNPVDGSLGPWTVAGSFPGEPAPLRAHGTAYVYNGKVYYAGGEDGTTASSDVFVADIHPDGTLTWTHKDDFSDSLPAPTLLQGGDVHNNILYVWGGSNGDGTLVTTSVYLDRLTATGDTTPWEVPGSALPEPRSAMASGILHGYAFAVNGSDDIGNWAPIAAGEIGADGSIAAFTDTGVNYAEDAPLRDVDGAAWQGRFYVAGGRTNADNDPSIDATGKALAAAITFADSGTYVSNGHYESTILDLGKAEALQTLTVNATGSGVTLSTRTAGADGVFGPWTKQSGLTVTFSAGSNARYVQFALDLTGGASAPVVSSVALNYGTPGVVPGGDARKALEIAGGLRAATPADITALDKNSDGKITIEDVVLLAKS